jgi:hypothetical protein
MMLDIFVVISSKPSFFDGKIRKLCGLDTAV